jgi:RNA polymerase sigma-70 factor (ECF subfamily)
LTDASDEVLVDRVLGGDVDAFGILVDRYQDQMMRYVRHMGFSGAEAEDLVQDAFVRGFRHLKRCGDPARFSGWLFRIVSNLCKTAGRKKSARVTVTDHDGIGRMPGGGKTPEDHAHARAVQDRVREALDTLPDEMKEALVLMYLEGMSVNGIVEMTGASPSAVKMRLKRGRDALRDQLAPLMEEEFE